MNKRFLMMPLLAGSLSVLTAQAAEPLTVSVHRLTLDTALKVAQGAVVTCREKGVHITATVVDREGIVQVKLRDTLAAPITVEISERKAYTAVNFNAATSQLLDRSDSALGRLDSIFLLAGGIPIEVGGNLMGAVGVSGASSETDEKCALAGLQGVLEELQLAQ